MAFFDNRRPHQKWWLGLNQSGGAIYQHGELCYLLTIMRGVGAHSTGGTYSSPNEWQGMRRSIEEVLHLSGASWFLPFFEKGIGNIELSEDEILSAFTEHYGFNPIPAVASEYPLEQFNKS